MARSARRPARRSARAEAAKAFLYDLWRFIFMLVFIAIILFVWLVQAQAITLPDWARDWSAIDDETRTAYAAALFTIIALIFLFFIAAGIFQMRREAKLSNPSMA